jgi:hypothetical protein
MPPSCWITRHGVSIHSYVLMFPAAGPSVIEFRGRPRALADNQAPLIRADSGAGGQLRGGRAIPGGGSIP